MFTLKLSYDDRSLIREALIFKKRDHEKLAAHFEEISGNVEFSGDRRDCARRLAESDREEAANIEALLVRMDEMKFEFDEEESL